MSEIDLTPFGFTPTENVVYSALLDRGPSGGYQLANALQIARANVYQALRGLESKGAAVLVGENPSQYRAVKPDAVFAMVADTCNRQLDDLETQISARPSKGKSVVVELKSERTLVQLVTRTAARTDSPVGCVAPADLMKSLTPVWRKRAADNLVTDLWVVGDATAVSVPISGSIDPDSATPYFNGPFCLFFAEAAALTATLEESRPSGYWTDDPVLIAPLRAAFSAVTRTA